MSPSSAQTLTWRIQELVLWSGVQATDSIVWCWMGRMNICIFQSCIMGQQIGWCFLLCSGLLGVGIVLLECQPSCRLYGTSVWVWCWFYFGISCTWLIQILEYTHRPLNRTGQRRSTDSKKWKVVPDIYYQAIWIKECSVIVGAVLVKTHSAKLWYIAEQYKV